MNERHMNEVHPGSVQVRAAWDELAAGLAAQIGRMVDESDHLILELPDGDDGTTRPYAQFAVTGDGRLRAELSGNAYLPAPYVVSEAGCATLGRVWSGNDEAEPNWFLERDHAEAERIAVDVITALRLAFGVAHPQLLTYRAWGANAAGAASLGLSATLDVPAEEPAQPWAVQPESLDELTTLIRMVLDVKFEGEPTVDSDGDYVLTYQGQPVWVRARKDVPAIEIFTRVAHHIHSRRATAVELGILTRQHPFVTWSQVNREVWQHIVFPALPFAPGHLDAMLDVFLAVMTETRDDLALRVGGRVA